MEDKTGAIWIGGYLEGVNRYDPVSKKVTHYGNTVQQDKFIKSDTLSGFNEPNTSAPLRAISSKDGLLWIGTQDGNLYNIKLDASGIPYYNINADGNSFLEEGDSILWIATGKGLLRRNRKTGIDKKFVNEPNNNNSLPNDNVLVLRPDREGNFWIGTFGGGICRFDPRKNIFSGFSHEANNNNSLAGDSIYFLHFDESQNLWIGIFGKGVDKMNMKSGKITHYKHDDKDSNSLVNGYPNCISEDKNNNIWIGTARGLDLLDQKSNRFYHYLKQSEILSSCIDASGDIWAGSTSGLYRFDRNKNDFTEYIDLNSPVKIKVVLHILEDDQHNLWLSTANKIIKINAERNSVSMYGKSYGVHANTFYLCDNYKAKNGEIFLGDQSGYYAFFPDQVKETQPPLLNITEFKLGDQEIMPVAGSVLKDPVWQNQVIKLNYKQNIFSFDFKAIDYIHPGEIKYLFMLENYDNNWHDLGPDHKAYFLCSARQIMF